MARILISGATSGLGAAVARHLVAAGDDVWGLGTTADGVQRALGGATVTGASVCDVTDERAVTDACAQMISVMGGIDGVFVNAGIDGLGVAATELDSEHFLRVLDVNVRGAFLVARHAARAMQANAVVEGGSAHRGAIVFNASINAVRPEALFADYNASKAAVVALAKTMALELAPSIAVTAIAPGYFPSRMTQPYLDDPDVAPGLLSLIPAGRFGDPADLASLVAFLLSPTASYMTGGVITIDGGRSV